MFRKVLTLVLAIMFAAYPAMAGTRIIEDTITLSGDDDGDNEVMTTTSVDIRDAKFVSIDTRVVNATGSATGDATVTIEGMTSTSIGWQSLYVAEYTDSLDLIASTTYTAAGDTSQVTYMLCLPSELKAGVATADQLPGEIIYDLTYFPYTSIRLKYTEGSSEWETAGTFTVRFVVKE